MSSLSSSSSSNLLKITAVVTGVVGIIGVVGSYLSYKRQYRLAISNLISSWMLKNNNINNNNNNIGLSTKIDKYLYKNNNMKVEDDKNKMEKISFDCSICLENYVISNNNNKNTNEIVSIQQVLLPQCKHSCCLTCFQHHLSFQVGDRSRYPLRCFEQCQEIINKYADEKSKRLYTIWSNRVAGYQVFPCGKCQELLIVSPNFSSLFTFNLQQWIICNHCCTKSCYLCERITNGIIDHNVCKQKKTLSNTKNNLKEEEKDNNKNILNEEIIIQKQREEKTNKLIADLELLEAIESGSWAECPTCQGMMEKTEGCNHMKHIKCPGNEDEITHFCYLCNTRLHPESLGEYDSGETHWISPNGVYDNCKRVKEAK